MTRDASFERSDASPADDDRGPNLTGGGVGPGALKGGAVGDLVGALAATEGRIQQSSQSSFRAGVEIVEVPVTVLDGKRQPVRGLSVEDFTILEDGKTRPVVTFAAVGASLKISSAPNPLSPPISRKI